MSTLAERLDEMARLYRGYERQLVEWLDEIERLRVAAEGGSTGVDPSRSEGGTPSSSDIEYSLGRLASLEEAFMKRARELGDGIEGERRRLAHARGADLSLKEASADPGAGEGAPAACADAAAAVAAVARRRVAALRSLEVFRESVRADRGKLAAARRLGKMYYRRRGQGRRVDGHV